MKNLKKFQELNLIDSAFFQIFTENVENAKLLSKIIIKRVTGHDVDEIIVESEKEISGLLLNNRGIRMDLCTSEMDGEKVVSVYDLEPNKYTEYNLPLRSRYYQALSDGKSLRKNEDFEVLPQFISIWILPYDPFDDNRMLYTVKNLVEENPSLVYNDKVIRYILYDCGEVGGSEELKALLKFITKTCEENAIDEELKQLYDAVVQIRRSEEAGRKYMTWEKYVRMAYGPMIKEECEEACEKVRKETYEKTRKEALAIGLAEGRAEGLIESTILTCKELNQEDSLIIKLLMKNCSLTEDEARSKLSEYSK